MSSRQSRPGAWPLVGTTVLPIVAMTIYLLWIWPRPRGASFLAEAGPYLLSLLAGLPFAFFLAQGARRVFVILVYLTTGFAVLWLYALAILCGMRGMCL